MKQHRYLIIIAVITILNLGGMIYLHTFPQEEEVEEEFVILLPEHPFYLLEEVNEEVLYKTLKHYEFPSPAIITAQAVLESGNFKSRLFLTKCNMFGLYNSKKLAYFNFDSWISCVFGYKKYILNKYEEDEDYYSFLKRIKYAEDPGYISKLKEIEKRILTTYETKERSPTK